MTTESTTVPPAGTDDDRELPYEEVITGQLWWHPVDIAVGADIMMRPATLQDVAAYVNGITAPERRALRELLFKRAKKDLAS